MKTIEELIAEELGPTVDPQQVLALLPDLNAIVGPERVVPPDLERQVRNLLRNAAPSFGEAIPPAQPGAENRFIPGDQVTPPTPGTLPPEIRQEASDLARGASGQTTGTGRGADVVPTPARDAERRSIQDAIRQRDELLKKDKLDPEEEGLLAQLSSLLQQSVPWRPIQQLTGYIPDAQFFDELHAAVLPHLRELGVVDLTNDQLAQLALDDPIVQQAVFRLTSGRIAEKVDIVAGNGRTVVVPRDEWEMAQQISGIDTQQLAATIGFSAEHDLPEDVWKYVVLAGKELGVYDLKTSDVPDVTLPTGESGRDDLRRARVNQQVEGLVKRFRAALPRYNDVPELAFLSMFDKHLADVIYENGGAPDEATVAKVQEILGHINMSDVSRLGININSRYWAAIRGEDGSASRENVQLPDPASLRETYRQLYASMFLTQPTDIELDGFVSSINSAIIGEARKRRDQTNIFKNHSLVAGADQIDTSITVDPSARAMEALRANPNYQKLYGHAERAGMSPAEYQSYFKSKVLETGLTPSQATSAIVAGMQTGDTDTTQGRILFSDQLPKATSLVNRLARAASQIGRRV